MGRHLQWLGYSSLWNYGSNCTYMLDLRPLPNIRGYLWENFLSLKSIKLKTHALPSCILWANVEEEYICQSSAKMPVRGHYCCVSSGLLFEFILLCWSICSFHPFCPSFVCHPKLHCFQISCCHEQVNQHCFHEAQAGGCTWRCFRVSYVCLHELFSSQMG